jgi:signal peptidase II
MSEAIKTMWPRWLLLSLIVLVLDLLTKHWVSSNMVYGESRVLTSWFNLVSARNTGAAFSFLANAGGWQRWFFIVVTVIVTGVLINMMRMQPRNRMLLASCALVIGGALGNLHDRLRFGYVVDFVQWHYGGWAWPAFNIADSAICLGVALLIIDSFRKRDA